MPVTEEQVKSAKLLLLQKPVNGLPPEYVFTRVYGDISAKEVAAQRKLLKPQELVASKRDNEPQEDYRKRAQAFATNRPLERARDAYVAKKRETVGANIEALVAAANGGQNDRRRVVGELLIGTLSKLNDEMVSDAAKKRLKEDDPSDRNDPSGLANAAKAVVAPGIQAIVGILGSDQALRGKLSDLHASALALRQIADGIDRRAPTTAGTLGAATLTLANSLASLYDVPDEVVEAGMNKLAAGGMDQSGHIAAICALKTAARGLVSEPVLRHIGVSALATPSSLKLQDVIKKPLMDGLLAVPLPPGPDGSRSLDPLDRLSKIDRKLHDQTLSAIGLAATVGAPKSGVAPDVVHAVRKMSVSMLNQMAETIQNPSERNCEILREFSVVAIDAARAALAANPRNVNALSDKHDVLRTKYGVVATAPTVTNGKEAEGPVSPESTVRDTGPNISTSSGSSSMPPEVGPNIGSSSTPSAEAQVPAEILPGDGSSGSSRSLDKSDGRMWSVPAGPVIVDLLRNQGAELRDYLGLPPVDAEDHELSPPFSSAPAEPGGGDPDARRPEPAAGVGASPETGVDKSPMPPEAQQSHREAGHEMLPDSVPTDSAISQAGNPTAPQSALAPAGSPFGDSKGAWRAAVDWADAADAADAAMRGATARITTESQNAPTSAEKEQQRQPAPPAAAPAVPAPQAQSRAESLKNDLKVRFGPAPVVDADGGIKPKYVTQGMNARDWVAAGPLAPLFAAGEVIGALAKPVTRKVADLANHVRGIRNADGKLNPREPNPESERKIRHAADRNAQHRKRTGPHHGGR